MKLPEIVSCVAEGNALIYTLHIQPDLAYFPGHFPGAPILPGVVQIDWAKHFASLHWPMPEHINKLEQLKFQMLIMPGDQVSLRLEFDADKKRLSFVFDSAKGRCSSGRLSGHA